MGSTSAMTSPAPLSALRKATSRWFVATLLDLRVLVLSSVLRSTNQSVGPMERLTATDAIFRWLRVPLPHLSQKPTRVNAQNVLLNALTLDRPAPYLKMSIVPMGRSVAVANVIQAC